jgi:ferrous iron transport protein B
LASDLTNIGAGLFTATLDAGKRLLSVIPGLRLGEASSKVEDTALSAALRPHFTSLSAFALLVFVLLYVPCVAVLGAIRHEFGPQWAVFSAIYQTSVAWLAAVLVFQGGRFLGLG